MELSEKMDGALDQIGHQIASVIYVEAQRLFVDYYAGLAGAQLIDQSAQGEELPNILKALEICCEQHWWVNMALILLASGGVLVDRGFGKQYHEWLETVLQAPEIIRQTNHELFLELLDSYAMEISSHGDVEHALITYHQVIELAQRDEGLSDILARAYFGLGVTLFICHKISEARVAWGEALRIAHEIGDHMTLAAVQYFLSEGQGNADVITSILELSDKSSTKLDKWLHYINDQFRAYRLLRSGQYDEAEIIYQQLVDQAQQMNELQGLAIALFHLGNIAALSGRDNEALQLLHQSEAITIQRNDHIGLALIYSLIGLVYIRQSRFDLSRPYLEESVRLEREYGHTAALGENLYWLGYALANTGDLMRGMACFQEAKSVFLKTDSERVREIDEAIDQLRTVIASTAL